MSPVSSRPGRPTSTPSKDEVINGWVRSQLYDECVRNVLSSANKGVGYAVPSPRTPLVSINAAHMCGSLPCKDPMSCSPLCLGRHLRHNHDKPSPMCVVSLTSKGWESIMHISVKSRSPLGSRLRLTAFLLRLDVPNT